MPINYTWTSTNIIYNHNINLYQYIYGVDIKLNFNNICYDMKQWIPYRDNNIIDIIDINNKSFKVLLNLQYSDSSDKQKLLQQFNI